MIKPNLQLFAADPVWNDLGANITMAGVDTTSSAKDTSGNIVVAFADAANEGKLSVKKYNGTTWSDLGVGISQGAALKIKIQISGNNIFVCYEDQAGSQVCVLHYDGATWTDLLVPYVAGTVYELQLTVDTLGHPIIAFRHSLAEFAYNQNVLLYVQKYDGANWIDLDFSSVPFSDAGLYHTAALYSMCLDSVSNVYIVYQNKANRNTYAVKYDGTLWSHFGSYYGTQIGGTTYKYPTAIVDSNDNLTVIYVRSDKRRLSIVQFDGASWTLVTSTEPINITSLSLRINANNALFFTMVDTASSLIAMEYDGANWLDLGVVASGPVSGMSSVINNAGDLVVAFSDSSIGSKLSVKRYGLPPSVGAQPQATKILLRRGLKADLPSIAEPGELLYATDSKELYAMGSTSEVVPTRETKPVIVIGDAVITTALVETAPESIITAMGSARVRTAAPLDGNTVTALGNVKLKTSYPYEHGTYDALSGVLPGHSTNPTWANASNGFDNAFTTQVSGNRLRMSVAQDDRYNNMFMTTVNMNPSSTKEIIISAMAGGRSGDKGMHIIAGGGDRYADLMFGTNGTIAHWDAVTGLLTPVATGLALNVLFTCKLEINDVVGVNIYVNGPLVGNIPRENMPNNGYWNNSIAFAQAGIGTSYFYSINYVLDSVNPVIFPTSGTAMGLFDTGYLEVSPSPKLDISGDFTLRTKFLIYGALDSLMPIFVSPNNYYVYLTPTKSVRIDLVDSNGVVSSFESAPDVVNTGSWSEIEVSRSGDTLKVFLDGVAVITETFAGPLYMPGTYIWIGFDGAYYFKGLMDDLEIANNIARHTNNYVPTTLAIVKDQYSVLLLHMNGVDDSVVFIDETAMYIYPVSGTGMAQFTTTGDALAVAYSPKFDLTTDFAIKCDFALSTLPAPGEYAVFASQVSQAVGLNYSWFVGVYNEGTKYQMVFFKNWNYDTTETRYQDIQNLEVGVWHNYEFRLTGTELIFLLDGVEQGERTHYEYSFTRGMRFGFPVFEPFYIGGAWNNYYASKGFMDNFELINEGATVLKLNMDGTDNSTVFTGETISQVLLTPESGSGMAHFEGNGNYLFVPYSEDFNFATGAFSIICNFSPSVLDGNTIFGRVKLSPTYTGYYVCVTPEGAVQLRSNDNSYLITSPDGVLTVNQFSKIELSSDGTLITMLVNDIAVGTYEGGLQDYEAEFTIGGNGLSSITGFIDSVQVTKNGQNVLSLNMDGTEGSIAFIDSVPMGPGSTMTMGLVKGTVGAHGITKEKLNSNVYGAGLVPDADESMMINPGDGIEIYSSVALKLTGDSLEITTDGLKAKAVDGGSW